MADDGEKLPGDRPDWRPRKKKPPPGAARAPTRAVGAVEAALRAPSRAREVALAATEPPELRRERMLQVLEQIAVCGEDDAVRVDAAEAVLERLPPLAGAAADRARTSIELVLSRMPPMLAEGAVVESPAEANGDAVVIESSKEGAKT